LIDKGIAVLLTDFTVLVAVAFIESGLGVGHAVLRLGSSPTRLIDRGSQTLRLAILVARFSQFERI
jgi:hypothetical protein